MAQLVCTKCERPLEAESYQFPRMSSCSGCGRDVGVIAFPALERPVEKGRDGQKIVIDSDSSCFYHPSKKAVVPCESCGRFLCSLCDLELEGKHLCPGCLEKGKKEGKMKSLENRRYLYDNVALGLAVIPILMFYIIPLTAPAAVIYAIVTWKKPGSILPRTKIRYILAVLIALIEIGAILAVFIAAFGN